MQNNVKVASQKRLQQLIDLQTARDNIMLQQVKVNEEIQKDKEIIPPEPINKATALSSSTKKPANIHTIIQEEEPPSITQAPSCNSPRSAMFLSQEALHFVLGQSMITDTPGQIPDFSEQNSQGELIGVTEMANGMVHPITNETITSTESW